MILMRWPWTISALITPHAAEARGVEAGQLFLQTRCGLKRVEIQCEKVSAKPLAACVCKKQLDQFRRDAFWIGGSFLEKVEKRIDAIPGEVKGDSLW